MVAAGAEAHAVAIQPVIILDLVTLMPLDRLLFRIHFVFSCPVRRLLQFQQFRRLHRSVTTDEFIIRKTHFIVNGMEKSTQ